jgi:hypothetical protein
VRSVLSLLFLALVLGGCPRLEKSASEDPMKCERDPKCESKRSRAQDCSTQCSDDPACVQRCEEFQASTKLGH